MDIRHYYTEKGQGEPVIFLHGNGDSCDYFVRQTDFFAKRYHVYAIDTRGHGRTPKGTEPFTISRFADDLLCFMDDHSIAKAHILGFSDGGNIALEFALRYPDRVDRLILNGANLDPKGVKPSTQIPIEIGYSIAKLFAKKNDKVRQNAEMLGLMVNEPHIDPEDLKKVSAKTLVIAGTNDMIKTSHTRLIAEKIPNSTLVFIKGDHFIAAKHSEEFNRAVLDFLNE
jgi:pimeloyl-ACP methyl ester carboxylesterase